MFKAMNTDELLKRIMERIAEASSQLQTAEIARLNRAAQRVIEIQETQAKLAAELHRLSEDLRKSASVNDTSRGLQPTATLRAAYTAIPSSDCPISQAPLRGSLVIEVDWPTMGQADPKQTISERKASDTLRVLLEEIHARFGDAVMERIAHLRANRAPPVSRRPEVDFLNRRRGTPYQHQRVGRSGWHVLTNSSTPEKIEFIRSLPQALRCPPAAITARMIDVQQEIARVLS